LQVSHGEHPRRHHILQSEVNAKLWETSFVAEDSLGTRGIRLND
jgi:hypothetical protein